MDRPPLNRRISRRGHTALAVGLFLAALGPAFSATRTLIWSDEFNQPDGTGPDPTKWTYDLGAGMWGNDELEFYTDSRANSYVISDPDAVDGKALVIAALKDPVYGTYTSARLQTGALFQTSYGHIEARIKTTSTQGLWPAFWMLGGDFLTGTNWPDCGEIDILETIDSSEVLFGTVHGPGYGIGGQVDLPEGQNFSQAYHVVALDWEPNQLQWSLDGAVYWTVTPADLPAGAPWEFNNSPFFILINLAVGGDWPGNPDSTSVFPALYTIDYVRVYGLPPTAPGTGLAVASSPGEVDLSWSPPSDLKGFALTGYQVTRATNGDLTQNVITFNVGPTASFADTFAKGGTTYYYSVVAVSTGGASDPSPVLSATTPLPAPGSAPGQVTNLSARGFVGTGDGVLIGGFYISGTTSRTVLIQALGPALGVDDVSGLLQHPALSVHQTQNGKDVVLYTNTGWDSQGPAAAAVLANAASAVYAQPSLTPGTADSELLVTLPPGGYTAEVSGADGGTGVALCAIYQLP
jgi:beta-glucanase (GH16 family)